MDAVKPFMRSTRVNGRWNVVMPSHRTIRYLEEDMWEKERLASMALHIRPDDVVLDVGAEEGDMSALFASWAYEGGIMLMEPNPRVWPNIKAIWDANHLPTPIATYCGFASNVNETIPGQLPPLTVAGWPPSVNGPVIGDHGFRQLAEETDTTPQITVDELAAVRVPTVITMDVEGAELAVLEGASETLHVHRPKVWISVHPEFLWHHFQHTAGDIYQFMEECGYRHIHLGDDHESHDLFLPR